jgi:GxxExxY protein
MNLDELNKISGEILESAIEVHKQLGPGLLESVYEICLCKELALRNIPFKRQISLPITYKNEKLESDFKIDLLIHDEIIVELKAVDTLLPVHNSQLLIYLRLANKRLGLLINFNVSKLKDGFQRVINGYDDY